MIPCCTFHIINHQGSGPGRHGSWRVCLAWLSYPLINQEQCDISRRSSMQSLEISRGHGSPSQRSWSSTTRVSYQYSCMVRTAGRYLNRELHARNDERRRRTCMKNGSYEFAQYTVKSFTVVQCSPFNRILHNCVSHLFGLRLKRQLYRVSKLAVDGWDVTVDTVRRGLGGLWPRPSPFRCINCNSPPINGRCTNHCIRIWWFVALRF